MQRIVGLCLYTNSIEGMCRDLFKSNPPLTREEIMVAAQQ